VRIAVIGTGKMGLALGTALARAGHDVRVGSRDRGRGAARAAEIGATFGGRAAEAADGVEAVLLAVPWWAAEETLSALGDLHGVILIDPTNPFEKGSSEHQRELSYSSIAEQLHAHVPTARVVKAWNHVYFEIVRRGPDFGGTPATIFVAGDDAEAKGAVMELVRDCGYAPADAGPLRSARYLERLAALMTALDRVAGGRTEHALALLERPRRARSAAAEKTGTAPGTTTVTPLHQ
jgi:predicted dinucleotide-binding enzyme